MALAVPPLAFLLKGLSTHSLEEKNMKAAEQVKRRLKDPWVVIFSEIRISISFEHQDQISYCSTMLWLKNIRSQTLKFNSPEQ